MWRQMTTPESNTLVGGQKDEVSEAWQDSGTESSCQSEQQAPRPHLHLRATCSVQGRGPGQRQAGARLSRRQSGCGKGGADTEHPGHRGSGPRALRLPSEDWRAGARVAEILMGTSGSPGCSRSPTDRRHLSACIRPSPAL